MIRVLYKALDMILTISVLFSTLPARGNWEASGLVGIQLQLGLAIIGNLVSP